MTFRKILFSLIVILCLVIVIYLVTFKSKQILSSASPSGNYSIYITDISPWYLNQENFRVDLRDSNSDSIIFSFVMEGDSFKIDTTVWSPDERLAGLYFVNNRFLIIDTFLESIVYDQNLAFLFHDAIDLKNPGFSTRGDSIYFDYLSDNHKWQKIKIPLFAKNVN